MSIITTFFKNPFNRKRANILSNDAEVMFKALDQDVTDIKATLASGLPGGSDPAAALKAQQALDGLTVTNAQVAQVQAAQSAVSGTATTAKTTADAAKTAADAATVAANAAQTNVVLATDFVNSDAAVNDLQTKIKTITSAAIAKNLGQSTALAATMEDCCRSHAMG